MDKFDPRTNKTHNNLPASVSAWLHSPDIGARRRSGPLASSDWQRVHRLHYIPNRYSWSFKVVAKLWIPPPERSWSQRPRGVVA